MGLLSNVRILKAQLLLQPGPLLSLHWMAARLSSEYNHWKELPPSPRISRHKLRSRNPSIDAECPHTRHFFVSAEVVNITFLAGLCHTKKRAAEVVKTKQVLTGFLHSGQSTATSRPGGWIGGVAEAQIHLVNRIYLTARKLIHLVNCM